MKLRPYQAESIRKVKEYFSQGVREVVLAMSPGGGKTLTACTLIKDLDCRTLVLSHGTSVLRNQWKDRLAEYSIAFSTEVHSDSKVVVNLPQSLYRESGFKPFDLVVVDEAHEFYFADMVQYILTHSPSAKVLLLTGTPSKFIKIGTPMVLVSAEDILNSQGTNQYISDIYFGISETSEEVSASQFTVDGNLKEEFQIKHTQSTLGTLINSIATRLSQIYGNDYLSEISAKSAFEIIGKTLIACNNIKQAEEVTAYLIKAEVSCAISHSDNDPTSAGIQLFKTDPECKVLVVVNRGVLGFDFSDLHNVVDMTLSKNIDRMYQLYARVMRPKKGVRKLYFKVIPSIQSDMYKFYMTAAIGLLRSDIMSTYDGTNLMSIKIPTVINHRDSAGSSNKSPKSSNLSDNRPLEELFNGSLSVSDVMINTHKSVGYLTEVAYITLSELKHNEYGRRPHIVGIDEFTLVNYLQTGVLNPRVYSDNWDTGLTPVLIETLTTPFGIVDRSIPFKITNRGLDLDHQVNAYFSTHNPSMLDKWLPLKKTLGDKVVDLYNASGVDFPLDAIPVEQVSIVNLITSGLTVTEASNKLGIAIPLGQSRLKQALKILSEVYRARQCLKTHGGPDRVKRHYLDNMTGTEIANIEGVSKTSVNRTISQWRKEHGI